MQRANPVTEGRAPVPPTRSPALLGVIDVGSNTARLVLFRTASSGTVRAIEERKEVPRLGQGTGADGRLSPEAIARGVAALRRFSRVLAEAAVGETIAVATSAVRDAPNASEFVSQVERQSGVALRVLSGEEEARYAYLGVASAWELDTALVCDLGGGSMQMAEVRRGRLQNSVSLPLGALRLTQRYLPHDPPKNGELGVLRESVSGTLKESIATFGGEGYRLFGVGGSLRALARATIDLRDYPLARVHGYLLRDRDLDALLEILTDMPASRRRALPGIGSDRADVIVAGLVVYRELLRAAKVREILVSGTGIREGVAVEGLGSLLPAPAEELAHRSAAAAAEGLGFSLPHGEAVAAVAEGLFARLAARFDWGDSERRALLVAAWMHDSGVAVDLWRHARHSAYLIRNFPVWGLDQREVTLASMVAYLHEGDPTPSAWRKELLPILREGDLRRARELGALLQVSELLYPAAPRFSSPEGGKLLSVELGNASAPALHPRALEKVRKAVERELNLEAKIHDS